jgi:cell wall-associated NlpC family hydrolase
VIKKRIAGLFIAALLLFGTLPYAGQAQAEQTQNTKAKVVLNELREENISKTRLNIIKDGMKYLGTPYQFGSNRSNTKTFDCSDFVRQAFMEGAGIRLPSNSRTQAAYVKDIGKTTKDWRQLKPGDLMFFMSYKGSNKADYRGINKSKQRITHDGIYLGDGKILHTYSKKSGGVRIDKIEGTHWEHRFIFGGSALK